MRHADKTVTVFTKRWDPEKGLDVYEGTVIPNVSFFSRISTAVSTEGLAAACEGSLRVPVAAWPEGLDLKNGDHICEGSVTTQVGKLSDLDKLCPYVFTVVGITGNTSGKEPHIKVVCK